MKTKILPALIFTFLAVLAVCVAMAQTPSPSPVVLPTSGNPPPAELPEPQPSMAPQQQPSPAALPSGTATPAAQNAAAAPSAQSTPHAQNEIRVNFQNASLTDVLNYLSEAAGFVIVQDTPVSGTVNVVSKRPVTADEAVDLLNAVLVEKGYIAILNGRILKIVSSHDAQKHDLPVVMGSDPDQIPRKDGMVTQILPIRYVEANKLIENLRPLLSADATINANDNSNAILLTDTQTNIHRIAEIIHALDTSISSISSIHVFPLRYADAKDFATMLTQLFNPDQSRNNQQQNQLPPFLARFAGGGRGGGGGGGGGGGNNEQPQSEARQAATRVVAVADTQTNSVVVSAPEEYMTTIMDIVNRLDTSTTDITETRIFRLDHADSVELSTILNSLYGDTTTTNGGNGNRTGNQGQNGQRGGNNNPQPAAGSTSQRALLQARVIAVPDQRTNSIIVNASQATMEQIALTIGRLDATDMKKQHVYVHVLEHADPDNVATILRGMFGDQSNSTNSAQPTSSALNQRTTTGASSDVTNTLNTSSPTTGGAR